MGFGLGLGDPFKVYALWKYQKIEQREPAS